MKLTYTVLVSKTIQPPGTAPGRPGVRARLVAGLSAEIVAGRWPPGSALPSVRELARSAAVSAFTAAEAYNMLVASGLVEARRGSGHFVTGTRVAPRAAAAPAVADALWERRREAAAQPIRVDAGGGWLPADWQYGEGVRGALRALARRPLPDDGYGSPFGHAGLRAHLQQQWRSRGLALADDQVLLTNGASQALDLIVRTLLERDDVVAVEDPAYPPTLELLRARGLKLLAVPRLGNGPDVEVLARALRRRRIRAFFTNTTLHNPTGTTTELPVAHRILELAERHDLTIVEDDIFGELAPAPVVNLAMLDQCRRVVHVSSVSKTIAPSLRVGHALAAAPVLQRLARAKVLAALATSEIMEQLVLQVLTDPHYRRHLHALRQRLGGAQQRVQATLRAHGVELAFRPAGGMFLWGHLRSPDSVSRLWRRGVGAGILLAPGESFRPDGRATPWWRFNVAHCEAAALTSFLEGLDMRATGERGAGTSP